MFINNISGSIPTQIAVSSLRQYYAGANDFSGTIPTELGMNPLLQQLYQTEKKNRQYQNKKKNTWKLMQSFDTQWNSFVWLMCVDRLLLSCSRVESNRLTGTIPTELGRNTALSYLYIKFYNWFWQ